MSLRTLLLTAVIAFVFTACQATPDVALTPTFQKYAQTETLCKNYKDNPKVTVPSDIKDACSDFTKRLTKANQFQYDLDHFNDNTVGVQKKPSPAYLELKKETNYQRNRLDQAHALFAKRINELSLHYIASDQLFDVELTLTFKETQFTKEHYLYYKKLSPLYDTEPHFVAYAKRLSSKHIKNGLNYLSQGKKKRALSLFKEASSLGSAEGAYLSGIVYEEKHLDKAIEWHTKAVERGMRVANINLAHLYKRKREPKIAYDYYLIAAQDGNIYAQFLLYQQYSRSKNTKARNEADAWLITAAENGFAQAQYLYGLQLLKQKKRKAAKKWIQKSYKNGYRKSSATLGALYFKDEKYTTALKYLQQADSAYAKYRLGMIYEHGLGVRSNSYTAYIYYKESLKLGRKRAKKDVARLKRQYTDSNRAHYEASKRKADQKEQSFITQCGVSSIVKNLRIEGTLIHLEGMVTLPLKSRLGFVLHNDKGEAFYVINPDQSLKLSPYQFVDISVKTTGHAVKISNNEGLVSPVYQLLYQKKCHH